MNLFLVAVVVALAYLGGSVDFAVHVSRRLGINIYDHGSGNPGTSNVFRALGKKAAGVVLVGDALKGLIAAGIGSAVFDPVVGFVCALAATLGHAFPIWHGFRGGRGVATAIGSLVWLAPLPGLALAVAWVGVVVATKTASVASLTAMVLYVPAAALGGHRSATLVWAAATALVVLWRHSDNIKRIVERKEHQVVA